MIVKQINGNLLDSIANCIAHQCNCGTAYGSGVALAMRKAFPKTYENHLKATQGCANKEELLGKVIATRIGETQYVLNLYGQKDIGQAGTRYTSYDAIYTCLEKARKFMLDRNFTSIAFPYGMSSVRGGASWKVILAMIESVFEDTEITVEIWKL